jgi:hypothetical protein
MSDIYFNEKNLLNAGVDRSGNAASVAVYFRPVSLDDDPDAQKFKNFVGGGLENNQLVIETGADEITWGYGMNVSRTPTYGGEVVQILSMYADKLNIKGVCQNYGKQREICEFFQRYIGYVTGSEKKVRRQGYLQFSYPARDWNFIIMVTEAPDLMLATEVVTPEWKITAEIVSENDRYALGKARHDQMSSVLKEVIPQNTPKSRRGAALNVPQNVQVTTNDKGRVKNFLIKRTTNPLGDPTGFLDGSRGKIAENFAALQASWATGSIETLRYNPLVAPEKSASEIWASKFGSDTAFVVGGGGGSGTVGGGADLSGISAGLTGTLDPTIIAALASKAFTEIGAAIGPNAAVNIKALAKDPATLEKAVGISYKESTWTVEAIHHNVDGTDPANPSVSQFLSGPSTTVPSSENTAAGNYDLGLWQINNYYHPCEIARSCGYTGQDIPAYVTPQAGSDAWKKVEKVCVDNDYFHQMITDAYANAKAMAYIYSTSHWDTWTTKGQSVPDTVVSQIKKAVKDYLANPQTYESQIFGGGNTIGAPLDANGKAAIAYLQQAIKNHRLDITHGNDRLAITNGSGIVIGRDGLSGYGQDKITFSSKLLVCLAHLLRLDGVKSIQVTSMVGSHPQDHDHWYGMGMDISAINGIELTSPTAKDLTIFFLRAMWDMGEAARPTMTISGGNGKSDPDNQQYEWLVPYSRGPKWPDAVSDNSKHQDHIHVGYGDHP